eukprot:s2891_g7.t1
MAVELLSCTAVAVKEVLAATHVKVSPRAPLSPAVACLPPLPLAAIVPLCAAAAATIRHGTMRYVLGRPPTFREHCADRHAAQVPAAAEQRSPLHSPPSSAGKNKLMLIKATSCEDQK